jgi:large subunit ribosomal protein L21
VQQLFAIIETGGKQYRVAEGDVIKVELLQAEPQSTVEIDKVLAVHDGNGLTAGSPYVPEAKVSCTVLEHGKAKKVIVFKYKPKKNIRVKNGHRQPFTKLQVEKIMA